MGFKGDSSLGDQRAAQCTVWLHGMHQMRTLCKR
jgi:hypothetical protein